MAGIHFARSRQRRSRHVGRRRRILTLPPSSCDKVRGIVTCSRRLLREIDADAPGGLEMGRCFGPVAEFVKDEGEVQVCLRHVGLEP